MNTEALLRKHFEAAAARVEVAETPAVQIIGEVRRNRMWFGLGAIAAVLLAVVAVVGLLTNDSQELIGPATTLPPTTIPIVSETTTTTIAPESSTTIPSTTTTTTIPEETEVAWTAADAERDVENFLAALAAGAYEQAAWSMENNGGEFDGQAIGETPAQYLERVCADGVCRGPYTVSADGPGVINESSQASSTVTVTADSGATAQFSVFTFEGQRIVSGVPPAATGGEPGLVEQLFGDAVPDRVVVQRFDAFEIWESGTASWLTNWWADEIRSIERNYGVGWGTPVLGVSDPSETIAVTCGTLMTRGDAVLVLDQCQESGWVYTDLTNGSAVTPPIPGDAGEDGETPWFAERGATTLISTSDAEGALSRVEADGVNVTGDDYVGYLRLSVDGRMVAYVDHSDPSAYSHFWSPVVVVRDVASGSEIDRWLLDGPVLGLEFSGDWVVAWEGSSEPDEMASGLPRQVAAVAINVVTGEVNRAETGTRVFLPS